MADQEYNGDSGYTQNEGEQQMYTQDSGYENGPGGDGEEKKRDDDDRKIFVGGLSWETTQKDLKEHFEKFGTVVDSTLKTDPVTHRSRGFGFVLFSDKTAVDAVINHPERHELHGRNIDPKRAHARPKPEPVKKVFVGGIDGSTSEEVIRDYFGQFGKVTELDLPFDKIKGQRRAFCFITFDDESSVEKACSSPKQNVGGKEVDVKKATPRQDGQGWGQQQGWGGRGGRGGYDRGGRGGRGRGRGGQSQGWGQQGGGGWGGSGQQGYDYYGGNNYNQQYGYNGSTGSYDYYGQQSNPSYNNYNYDYYNQGWGNYGQGGSYGSYGNNSSGYDGSYGGWYTSQSGQQPSGGHKRDGHSNDR